MTQLNSEILAIEWTPPPPDVCSLPGILPSEVLTFGPHELGLVDSIFPGNVTPPVCSFPQIFSPDVSTFGLHELGLVDSIFPGNVTPPDFFPPFSLFPQAPVLI